MLHVPVGANSFGVTLPSWGTTTNRLWWWQVGWQIPSTDTSHNAGVVHVYVH